MFSGSFEEYFLNLFPSSDVMYTIWEAIKEFAGGVVICVYGALFHNRLFKRKTVNIKE